MFRVHDLDIELVLCEFSCLSLLLGDRLFKQENKLPSPCTAFPNPSRLIHF